MSAKPVPHERCWKCGQTHMEHDLIEGEFRCAIAPSPDRKFVPTGKDRFGRAISRRP